MLIFSVSAGFAHSNSPAGIQGTRATCADLTDVDEAAESTCCCAGNSGGQCCCCGGVCCCAKAPSSKPEPATPPSRSQNDERIFVAAAGFSGAKSFGVDFFSGTTRTRANSDDCADCSLQKRHVRIQT